jgi:hypothetical protein
MHFAGAAGKSTGRAGSHNRKEMIMGLFDKDPKYQKLKAHRDRGYDGWVDQDGNAVASNKSGDGAKKDAERARKLGRKGK